MAQIPPTKRLLTEDFKSESSWIGKLLYVLNNFMTIVTTALNNQLTVESNLAMELRLVTVVATPTYPIIFTCKFPSSRVRGLMVVNALQVTSGNYTPVGSAVYVDWTWDSGQVQIRNITGLTNGNTYQITLLVSYG